MPPKPSRSPLYFYASEYQQQYQRRHGRKLKINEAIAACYDDWKALSDEEKQVYKDQYEQWKIEYRANPTPSNVIDQKRDVPKAVRSDPNLHERVIPSEELKSHYDRFTSEQIFLATEYIPCDLSELLSMPIYIINFQIFCRIDEEDGGGFIPAEMSILHVRLTIIVHYYSSSFLLVHLIGWSDQFRTEIFPNKFHSIGLYVIVFRTYERNTSDSLERFPCRDG